MARRGVSRKKLHSLRAAPQDEGQQDRVRELDAERTWLEAVFRRSPAGIMVAEGPLGCITANPRAQELIGQAIPPNSPIGYCRSFLFHPDGRPYTFDELPLVRALRGDLVSREEMVIHRPDGGETPVLTTAGAIRDDQQAITGAVVIFQDISKLKEAERTRRDWTSIIAHDLRQPITVILGYLDLLHRSLARHAPPDRIESTVNHARSAAADLDRLIGDLLEVSRIEAGRLELNCVTVDLVPLARSVIEGVAVTNPDRLITLDQRGPVPLVCADPVRIKQVLSNLLSNALKYGYPGTPIRITLQRCDGHDQVAVANEGPGILPEETPQLFTRFYRTRTARAGGKGGLGMGLYIVHGIIQAHGGRVWVESTPGQITTFTFTIPLPAAAAA